MALITIESLVVYVLAMTSSVRRASSASRRARRRRRGLRPWRHRGRRVPDVADFGRGGRSVVRGLARGAVLVRRGVPRDGLRTALGLVMAVPSRETPHRADPEQPPGFAGNLATPASLQIQPRATAISLPSARRRQRQFVTAPEPARVVPVRLPASGQQAHGLVGDRDDLGAVRRLEVGLRAPGLRPSGTLPRSQRDASRAVDGNGVPSRRAMVRRTASSICDVAGGSSWRSQARCP